MNTKRFILMLLVMLGSVTGALAQEFHPSWAKGYYIKNVTWSNALHDYETGDKLFDENSESKWLVQSETMHDPTIADLPDDIPVEPDEPEYFSAKPFRFSAPLNFSVDPSVWYQPRYEWTQFETSEPVKVSSYTLMTGNDTKEYPKRNPRTWTFQGSKDNVNWTDLDAHEEDETMKDVNCVSYSFSIASEKQNYYKYYRLRVLYTVSSFDEHPYGWEHYYNSIIQIAELSLNGIHCVNHEYSDNLTDGAAYYTCSVCEHLDTTRKNAYELSFYKEEKIAALQALVDGIESTLIATKAEEGKTSINQATSKANVDTAYNNAASALQALIAVYNDGKNAFTQPTSPGMRLKVTKKDGTIYEFQTSELQKVNYYRAK